MSSSLLTPAWRGIYCCLRKTLADIRSRQTTPASLLERPLAYTGAVEASVADMPKAHRSAYRYSFQSGDEIVEAFGGPALSIRCGDQARLEGFRLGDKMVVTAVAVERSADAPAECKTEGVQKIAVILVNYPGVASTPGITRATVGQTLFGVSGQTLANFYTEASYGQLSLSGDIFGPYVLDRAYKCGEFTQLRTAALHAADADVDFRNYSRVMVIHPDATGCDRTGEGSLGCFRMSTPGEQFTASYADVIADPEEMLFTAIHELGHNLGVLHARTIRFPGTTTGPERELGAIEEYGDIFSIMGMGYGHFAAAQRASLGWLRPSRDYTVVQGSGTFDSPAAAIHYSGVESAPHQTQHRRRRPVGRVPPARRGVRQANCDRPCNDV